MKLSELANTYQPTAAGGAGRGNAAAAETRSFEGRMQITALIVHAVSPPDTS